MRRGQEGKVFNKKILHVVSNICEAERNEMWRFFYLKHGGQTQQSGVQTLPTQRA